MLVQLKSILRSKGYVLFTRLFELNIVGLRSKSTIANRFDDEIHVFYKVQPLKWHYHIYKATTDPGTFWLKNPLQIEGTAILAQGQYVNAYEIGMHHGQYKALVQKKTVSILRDYDRNAYLDFRNGKSQSGLFGINIHRALMQGKTKMVDKFSAGCQVFENASDFYEFMAMCEKHRNLYGNQFTYTLVDFRAARRANIRLTIIGTLTLGLGVWLFHRYNNNKIMNDEERSKIRTGTTGRNFSD